METNILFVVVHFVLDRIFWKVKGPKSRRQHLSPFSNILHTNLFQFCYVVHYLQKDGTVKARICSKMQTKQIGVNFLIY